MNLEAERYFGIWVIVGEEGPLHALDILAPYRRKHCRNSWLIKYRFE
jgi:hypothetical protein